MDRLVDFVLGIFGGILAAITIIAAAITIWTYYEDRKNPKYWRESDQGEKNRKRLDGKYYLFYIRHRQGGHETPVVVRAIANIESTPRYWRLPRPVVRIIARIENSIPHSWRWRKLYQTTIRILVPTKSEDLSYALARCGKADKDIFSLFGEDHFRPLEISDGLPSLSEYIGDIRGVVYFREDNFFCESRGMNNDEWSLHIGRCKNQGEYELFFTICAYIDLWHRPTGAACVFVKRGRFDKLGADRKELFISQLNKTARRAHAHLVDPVFLPGDDTWESLWDLLTPKQSKGSQETN